LSQPAFNIAAFVANPNGIFGDEGRNVIGPGLFNIDSGLYKNQAKE